MGIGGTDTVLIAPKDMSHGDLILTACQRLWSGHECLFQDASDIELHSLREPWIWLAGSQSRDFFVYRDRAMADSWRENGATRTNSNTMLQFILSAPNEDDGTIEIAVVYDRATRAVERFIRDLNASIVNLASSSPQRGAA